MPKTRVESPQELNNAAGSLLAILENEDYNPNSNKTKSALLKEFSKWVALMNSAQLRELGTNSPLVKLTRTIVRLLTSSVRGKDKQQYIFIRDEDKTELVELCKAILSYSSLSVSK